MIEKIAELNRTLIAIDELKDNNGEASYDGVIRLCKETVIEGRRPNHESTLTFAEKIKLITIDKTQISLTQYGKDFLNLNVERLYDLSEEQKKILLRMCYLEGPYRTVIYNLLKDFLPDFKNNTFKLSIFDVVKTPESEWVIEHLTQLNCLVRNDDLLEINSQYVNTIAHFLSEGKLWSPDDFEAYQEEREKIGTIAEDLIMEFEKNRLQSTGCKVEALCMRHISKLKVNAGYDIDSFNGLNPTLNYDRFIEIKGSKNSKVVFFWSDNEIRIAKELGEKYWIYFQGGIQPETKKVKNKPLLFQNPIKTILEDPTFKKRPQGLIIEKNLEGDRIEFK